jgi:hypothetical protein
MYKSKYNKKGQVGAVGAIITLVVGMGVAVLLLIFVGTLGGQTYQLTESKITAITNTTIRGYVTDSIASGFSALKTVSDYLPIVGLAVIIAVVLALVLGFTRIGAGGAGGQAL